MSFLPTRFTDHGMDMVPYSGPAAGRDTYTGRSNFGSFGVAAALSAGQNAYAYLEQHFPEAMSDGRAKLKRAWADYFNNNGPKPKRQNSSSHILIDHSTRHVGPKRIGSASYPVKRKNLPYRRGGGYRFRRRYRRKNYYRRY